MWLRARRDNLVGLDGANNRRAASGRIDCRARPTWSAARPTARSAPGEQGLQSACSSRRVATPALRGSGRRAQVARVSRAHNARSLSRNLSGRFARAVRDRRRARGAEDLARVFQSRRLRTVRENHRTPSRRKTRRARTRPALRLHCASQRERFCSAYQADNHVEVPTVCFLNRRATSSYTGRLNGMTRPGALSSAAQRQSTNSGVWVSSLISESRPLNRNANHF